MKKVILSISLIGAMLVAGCKNETKDVETPDTAATEEMSSDIAMSDITFGVRGNCGMCKSTIEKAANGVDGVAEAIWDVDRKNIAVSFDPTATDEMAIHHAIAASGYDTEKVAGDENAYNDLPQCCQYDHDMMMNQEVTEGEEGNHHMEEGHPMEESH